MPPLCVLYCTYTASCALGRQRVNPDNTGNEYSTSRRQGDGISPPLTNRADGRAGAKERARRCRLSVDPRTDGRRPRALCGAAGDAARLPGRARRPAGGDATGETSGVRLHHSCAGEQ